MIRQSLRLPIRFVERVFVHGETANRFRLLTDQQMWARTRFRKDKFAGVLASITFLTTSGCTLLPFLKISSFSGDAILCSDEPSEPVSNIDVVHAIRRGDVSVTLNYFKGGSRHIDDVLTASGQTAVCVACSVGVLPLVKVLLDAGAEPNIKDSSKATALSAACVSGNAHIVNRLLEVPNVCADSLDVNGLAPIHQAVGFGHPECIRCMLHHGLDPNLLTGSTVAWSDDDADVAPARYETPLHIAARLLTRAINSPDGSGSTEHQQRQRYAIMDMLISHGADPLARDSHGDTPLHHCARYGDSAGLWLLLGRTQNAAVASYATNDVGNTVLEEAIAASWVVGLVVNTAIQMHGTRLWWNRYWSVYEFIGKQ